MANIDLNLLTSLDALLAEGTVVGASRRLGLSPSAMSRTQARLRAATGDPLLVRAGRGMVPTPHATELRERGGPWPIAHGRRRSAELPSSFGGGERIRSSGAGDRLVR